MPGLLELFDPAGVLLVLEPEEVLPLTCDGGTVFPTAAPGVAGEVIPVVGVFVAIGAVLDVVEVPAGAGWAFPRVGVFVAGGRVLDETEVLAGAGLPCTVVGVFVAAGGAFDVGVFVGTAATTAGDVAVGVTQCGLPTCNPLPQTGPVLPDTGQPPPLGLFALQPVGVGALHWAPDVGCPL